MPTFAHPIKEIGAQMAESVDALVSNTSRFTPVPVRPRLWVLKTLVEQLLRGFLLFKTSKMVTFGHHLEKKLPFFHKKTNCPVLRPSSKGVNFLHRCNHYMVHRDSTSRDGRNTCSTKHLYICLYQNPICDDNYICCHG